MKRSEVNGAIRRAEAILESRRILLPPFAHWTPEDWRAVGPDCRRIRDNGMGWDVSDFGGGDFSDFGAVFFALRNGNHARPEEGTPYAEKVIVLTPGQRLPMHFHWLKTEDLINRGGGVMVMELYNARVDDAMDRTSPVTIHRDGRQCVLEAGKLFEIPPGESLTLTPRIYHRFWAKPGGEPLVCGEISTVNDDNADNCFAEPVSRFTTIDEDCAPYRLLCNEYPEAPGPA